MKRIKFLFLIIFVSLNYLQSQTFTVATYNMRNDNSGDSIAGNGWKQRCPVIANLILFHDFDIMGTQECFHHQLEDLIHELPDYKYIGVGRDDGKTKGEYSAIFYKTDKFKCLKNGNFWLSQDTSKPNLGWDAACIRICTWGEFREIKTGLKFFMFNLHQDHIGVEARKNSIKLILEKIKEMSENTPVILTGDFNVDQNDESYIFLNTSGVLRDAYDLSEICYMTNGTFNDFNPNLKTDSRIDHIFLTKEFKSLRYGILTDSYRSEIKGSNETIKSGNFPKEVSFQKFEPRLPSDHFPVVIKVKYSKQ